jgi:hypothetical protein
LSSIENIPGILKKSEIVLVNKTKHNHQDILSLSESKTRQSSQKFVLFTWFTKFVVFSSNDKWPYKFP